MSEPRSMADVLDGLAAALLAAETPGGSTDAGGADPRQELVRVGTALEEAVSDAASLPAELEQALGLALKALQRIYEGTVGDAPSATDAVAGVLAATAGHLREPGDAEASAVAEALDRLGANLGRAPAGADAPDGEASSAAVDPESPQGGVAAATTAPDASAASAGDDADAAPPRLPEDSDGELLGEFRIECLDHIAAAEAALLELERNAEAPEAINTVFRAFHTIKGTSGFLGLDPIQKLAHLAENLLDRAREGEIRIRGGYADLALSSCDALRTMIEGLEGVAPGEPLVVAKTYGELIEQLTDPAAAGIGEDADIEPMRTGDILVAQGRTSRQQVEQAARTQGSVPIGQKLIEEGAASPRDVAEALRTQNAQKGKTAEASVRVGTDRLDGLIDAVGELVIAQSMVAQDPAVVDGSRPQLARSVSHAGKIVRELQDVSMSLRMVPLKATFGKMARLVRDLARKAGKQVRFVSDGEDTEIDRNMVEVLNDPLVHMMRNAVDHGIETPQDRTASGKDPVGVVRLRAYHSAGNVVIELSDDGKGLDRERIVAKAIDRGLIASDEGLSHGEVFALIFQPGFSTAQAVTDISGRGVGMDVVKNGIESLRGRIEVNSQPGAGSTFTMRLPLTMAITDAMLLRVGRERYLLPIMSIERSFRPTAQQVFTVAGRGEMVQVRGELLPVFRLYELFGVPGATRSPTEALLILVEGEGKRYALLVDELLGQQQVVVKSLGRSLGEVPGISGGAILGDGRVGLILDAAAIVALAHGKKAGGGAAAAAA